MSIQIIYQDEYILAVNKPQALLSVPGLGPDKKDCMIARLEEVIPGVKVVHRLDCYTSGIMLFAIGIDMQRALSKIFHDRKINKHYIAVVRQWFDEDEGVSAVISIIVHTRSWIMSMASQRLPIGKFCNEIQRRYACY